MFDDYSVITGAQLNDLLDQGWIIASDGALLSPGTIEQAPETPPEPEKPSMPYSTTMHIWADVDGNRRGHK